MKVDRNFHSGLAPWIQENRDVPIYVLSKGISVCEQYCPYPKYRKMTWGVRKEFQALSIGD
jgi:ribonuclease/clavin/mitogillin